MNLLQLVTLINSVVDGLTALAVVLGNGDNTVLSNILANLGNLNNGLPVTG